MGLPKEARTVVSEVSATLGRIEALLVEIRDELRKGRP